MFYHRLYVGCFESVTLLRIYCGLYIAHYLKIWVGGGEKEPPTRITRDWRGRFSGKRESPEFFEVGRGGVKTEGG